MPNIIVEGDPRVVEWQVWKEEGFDNEPDVPDGMAAGGPWFPFTAYERADGGRSVVVHRRPLINKP